MPSQSKVCFFFERKNFALQNRKKLKAYIEFLFEREKKKLGSINYIFCSDMTLLEINRQFLNHDYYTDIISFDLSESDYIQAEVYISIDRVKVNSKSLQSTLRSELHRVVFHGALHLCGYGDKAKKEKEEKRRREDYYLLRFFK